MKKKKLAKVITDKLVLWLKDKGADKNLMAIGGDSSYMNKGREVGVKHHVDWPVFSQWSSAASCLNH